MYQVLYRKWRPQVFADVVGQPQVTVTLQHELMAGRVAHALLVHRFPRNRKDHLRKDSGKKR